MRILVHDFAGHPFQIQLSRELVSRGHMVTHVFPLGLQGPKGNLEHSQNDSVRLDIKAIPLSLGFKKYSPFIRFVSQRIYARKLKALIDSNSFDVVLSGNTPVDIQAELLLHCRRRHVAFVHWVQDVYSRALEFFLRRTRPWLAAPVGSLFRNLEILVARYSGANIVIASDFKELLEGWGVATERISVIENWAPIDEVSPYPRVNDWSKEQHLSDSTVFLYAGTLGMKHRPDLLYRLAKGLGAAGQVVVVSEGTGREYLEKQPALPNLKVIDFQPYARLPEVLSSADVLVATLESDAGEFAIPSKILTYLCAKRPLLFAAPSANLASAIVRRSNGGLTVDPDDLPSLLSGAKQLASDPKLRARLAEHGRRYAELSFDIARIAGLFESVLAQACAVSPARTSAKAVVSST